MLRRLALLVGLVAMLVVPTGALAATPFQRLKEHGVFWGRSITGARHSHPIRDQLGLSLGFGTITEEAGAGHPAIATHAGMFWEDNCNQHDYFLRLSQQRLKLGEAGTTTLECGGRKAREEHWLEGFFGADPNWSLNHGRLTLTSGRRRIALGRKEPARVRLEYRV